MVWVDSDVERGRQTSPWYYEPRSPHWVLWTDAVEYHWGVMLRRLPSVSGRETPLQHQEPRMRLNLPQTKSYSLGGCSWWVGNSTRYLAPPKTD